MNHPDMTGRRPPFARPLLTVAVLLAFAGVAHAAPVGGNVAAGGAAISTSGTRTTIQQSTASAVINWQSFGIAAGESVHFQQPGAASVALNRVRGSDPSGIFGSLSANGKVFLVNPNGVLFGKGASVNVGGLVASTLDIGDADFMAGRYRFSGTSRAAVRNEGSVQADGGYVVLIGSEVVNNGSISARHGHVAMAAGEAVTLDVLGDKLLRVAVDRGAFEALVSNGGLIQADGGQVLLTAQAAGPLLATVVNNTGVIQARTISNQAGVIKLLGDMDTGVMTVAGTLDASAPQGGDGGFIETSAARVKIRADAFVTTAATLGNTGTWLIDPQDFTIGGGANDNISGATLSALLVTNSVVITTAPGPTVTTPGAPPVTHLNTAVEGNGDINVNQAVSWTATPNTTTLTLNATRDVNINQAVTAVNGNLVVCCGRDVNVGAAITTTNGSVLLAAGRDVIFTAAGAMTTTDGNITICAANDIRIASALTLTRGSSIPSQSLGLQTGLVLSAGNGGAGPGLAGGTVVFAPLAPPAGVTGPNAPVTINYNPVAYSTPTNYAPNFTLTQGSTITQHMLVFGIGNKTFDGSTATVLSGLKGSPAGVTLVAGPGATANFDTAAVGTAKAIAFTGYTLSGADAANYALPVSCCGPVVGHTTGNVLAAVIPPVIPPLVPPVVPVVVPPIPVPVVIVPPPVVVAPGERGSDEVLPQFVPFAFAPVLLRPQSPLLFVAPSELPPMQLVLQETPVAPAAIAPTPAPATVPAPAAVEQAPAAPARAPSRPPRPYRN
jgi:filamentous hemagglutinin family protein